MLVSSLASNRCVQAFAYFQLQEISANFGMEKESELYGHSRRQRSRGLARLRKKAVRNNNSVGQVLNEEGPEKTLFVKDHFSTFALIIPYFV